MKSFLRLSRSTFAFLMLALVISGAQHAFAQSTIVISEFRFRGSSGGNDEFIELYNNSDNSVTVVDASPDANTTTPDGWALVAVNATTTIGTRFVIPNGTVIPARGHFLAVNTGANGYSRGSYAAGDQVANPTTGALSGGYGTGIVDGGGIALFSSANPANLPPTNTANPNPFRLDAVGFNSTQPLFFEGVALSPAGGITSSSEYSFVRKMTTGVPQDTNSNEADFNFIAVVVAPSNGRSPILGAPGPENLSSPVERNAAIKASLIEPNQPSFASPNRVRDPDDPAVQDQPFGSLKIRRRFTNNTDTNVTRLRFRVVNITTLNSEVTASPQADLRLLASSNETITPTTSIGVSSVNGTTLESPTFPFTEGGLNSSVTVIPPNGSLAPNATIDVQFTLGVEQNGFFRFFVNVEALPAPTSGVNAKSANLKRKQTLSKQ